MGQKDILRNAKDWNIILYPGMLPGHQGCAVSLITSPFLVLLHFKILVWLKDDIKFAWSSLEDLHLKAIQPKLYQTSLYEIKSRKKSLAWQCFFFSFSALPLWEHTAFCLHYNIFGCYAPFIWARSLSRPPKGQTQAILEGCAFALQM